MPAIKSKNEGKNDRLPLLWSYWADASYGEVLAMTGLTVLVKGNNIPRICSCILPKSNIEKHVYCKLLDCKLLV